MSPTLIITRPQPQADEWVARLQAKGVMAVACPLMETAARPTPPPARAADCAVWMFVSPAAVRFGLPRLTRGEPWAQCLPNTQAAATGPGTAAALLGAGVPAAQLVQPPADSPQFDSEALWAVLGPQRRWAGVAVGIVRGATAPVGSRTPHTSPVDAEEPAAENKGRAWLAEQWRQAGAAVLEWVAYERRAPVANPMRDALLAQARALPERHAWLISSAEALSYWPMSLAAEHQRAIATHPAIAAACQQHGFAQVHTCKPEVEAIAHGVATLIQA